ncbi:YbjQ family protein [uncultured Ilyobacter sp.]|uniref:YbjQ family protein n=1 Tax=uncultured Ilyobacter sp. TaxID=544433 RepID=UPI0029C8B7F7|nr:YbjQ family protein [uncultured Ilyobacter sp.]
MKTIRYIGSMLFIFGLFTSIFAGIPWAVVTAEDPVVPLWLRVAVFSLLGGIFIVLMTVGLSQKKYKTPEMGFGASKHKTKILMSNTVLIPGAEVSEILGLVQGHTVFAIWLGKDLSAIIKLILGGELTEYTEMMGKAREIATERMVINAEEIGADAIINIRYMTTSVVGSAAELFAYGTAVKLKKHNR